MRENVRNYGKKKRSELSICPICRGKSLKQRKYYRRNFPFGRKSKGRKVMKKVVSYCIFCDFRKESFSEISIFK